MLERVYINHWRDNKRGKGLIITSFIAALSALYLIDFVLIDEHIGRIILAFIILMVALFWGDPSILYIVASIGGEFNYVQGS